MSDPEGHAPRGIQRLALCVALLVLSSVGCTQSNPIDAMHVMEVQSAPAHFSGQGAEFVAALERADWGAASNLSRGSDIVNVIGRYGVTPLYYFVSRGRADAVEYLLGKGASTVLKPEWVGPSGFEGLASPLYAAAKNESPAILQLLLERGVPANNVITVAGETPLFVAVEYGRAKNIQLLLDSGASINLQTPLRGFTPLMKAVFTKRYKVATSLLAAGADPCLKSNDGVTVEQMVKTAQAMEVRQRVVASPALQGLGIAIQKRDCR